MTDVVRHPEVLSPNLGLYYNLSDLLIPRRGLKDGLNFRVRDGKLNNYNLGWTKFATWVLDGRVMKIFNHTDRMNGDTLIFADPTDIYIYNVGANTVSYLTPRYENGFASRAGTTVTGTDPLTKALLHMDGTDTSTTFTDVQGHVFTAVGNAQIDTADFVFGGASGLFDGTGDWITTPDSADWVLGTSNFSIRLRFKVNGGDGSLRNLAGQNDVGAAAATSSFMLFRQAANTLRFAISDGAAFTNFDTVATYTTAVNPGWHDLEVTRNGNVVTMYIDGVVGATGAFAGTVPNSASILGIGVTGASAANGWFGWIDEFRLRVGVADHTAAFTPATAAFTTDPLWLTNTKAGDQIHFGAIGFTDPTGQWDDITNVATDTSLTTLQSGAVSAGAYTIRKTYITGLSDQWQMATFLNDGVSGKDILFATNYVDWVQTWSFGDTQMTIQSGLGFKCKAIAPFSNMMLYANINDGALKPTSLINSDVSKPLAAGSLGTGLSEEFVVHPGVDGIDSMYHLANSIIIYSEKNITAAQFVGDPEVFNFRQIDSDVGPVGPFAVADFGDYHEFIGQDGAYRFDGVGAVETHSHTMRFIRAQMDPKRKAFTYSHFLDADGEALWSVPAVTDVGVGTLATTPEIAWAEHYLEAVNGQPRPFSRRQFPFTAAGRWTNATNTLWSDMSLTWADYASRWSDLSSAASIQHLTGDTTGQIWVINTVQQANGVGLASYVQFPRFAGGDMHQKNVLQRWNPYVTQGVGNITVTTFYSNFATGNLFSDPGITFDTAFGGEEFVSPMVKARFFAPQFGSSTGLAYQIEGYNYELLGVPGGRR